MNRELGLQDSETFALNSPPQRRHVIEYFLRERLDADVHLHTPELVDSHKSLSLREGRELAIEELEESRVKLRVLQKRWGSFLL